MRDPDRIDEILAEVSGVWHALPDWRLGQLISNISRACHVEDPFFLEDDKLLAFLKDMTHRMEEDKHAPKYVNDVHRSPVL